MTKNEARQAALINHRLNLQTTLASESLPVIVKSQTSENWKPYTLVREEVYWEVWQWNGGPEYEYVLEVPS